MVLGRLCGEIISFGWEGKNGPYFFHGLSSNQGKLMADLKALIKQGEGIYGVRKLMNRNSERIPRRFCLMAVLRGLRG